MNVETNKVLERAYRHFVRGPITPRNSFDPSLGKREKVKPL